MFGIIFLYLVGIVYLYTQQDKFIFEGAYGFKKETQQNQYLNDKLLIQKLTTKDNTILDGAIYKNDNNNLIIYFGGNKPNSLISLNKFSKYSNYDIVSFNYRGYGYSQDNPSQEKLYSDAIEIYDKYILQYKSITAVGRSLGSAMATYLGSKRVLKNIILITPFDVLANIAIDKYPIFPIKYLIRHPFDNIDNIRNITTPISILMLKGDKIVQNKYTLQLKEKVNNLKEFLILIHNTHSNIIDNPEVYKFIGLK